MRRTMATCALALLVAGVSCPAMAQSAPPPAAAPTPNPDAGRWVDLFDGKTFNGWVVEPAAQSDRFRIRDGVIQVEGSPQGGWLHTNRKYADFTLSYEVRYTSPDHTGNTGLILRSPEISPSGRNWPGRGFEVESRDMNREASLPPAGTMLGLQPGAPNGRFLFDTEAARKANTPTGTWDKIEVIAHGDHIWSKINGLWLSAAFNAAHPDGHIGFQAEDGTAEYRNIRIMEHAPATVTPDTWVKLFDGHALSGLAVSDSRYAGNMRVADGVLRLQGSGGWLRTATKYADYSLRLEFRTQSPDADSGVFLHAPGSGADKDGWPLGTTEAQLRHQANPPPTVAAGDRRWIGSFLRRPGGADGRVVIDTGKALRLYEGLGEWQTAEVKVDGRNATFVLNGEEVGSAQNIENPLGGFVGLQMGPGAIEFRSIEIKGYAVE